MKKYLLCASAIVTIALAGCGGGNSSYNGSLSFQNKQYKVSQSSVTELKLTLNNSTAENGAIVFIQSSDPSVATIINSNCTLSDESGFNSSCEVRVRGNKIGNAVITASASKVSPTKASVVVTQDDVVNGLTFEPSLESVMVGQDTKVMLKLSSGSNIDNLTVNLASSDPTIAEPEQKACTFNSDEKFCEVTINGNNSGSAKITATSADYNITAEDSVNVTNDPQPGHIAIIADQIINVGETVEAIVKLEGSSGITPFPVTLSEENSNVTITSTGNCMLSSLRPICKVLVTGNKLGTDTVLASANGYTPGGAIFTVTNKVTPGYLTFSSSSESVVFGAETNIKLYYDGGQGITNLQVAIASNSDNITLSTSVCTFDSKFPHNACVIKVTGHSVGQSTITASATGYKSATNQVTVVPSSVVVPGNIIFTPSNIYVKAGSTYPTRIYLKGSSNVKSINVAVNSNNSNASVTPASCTLSTAQDYCNVTISGVTAGNSVITASSAGYSNATAQVTVTNKNLQTELIFDQSHMGVGSYFSLKNQGQTVATLRLINGGLTPITVTIPSGSNPDAVGFGYFFPGQGSCIMSSESPVCYVKVTAQPGGVSGESSVVTPSATGDVKSIDSLIVTVRDVIPVARKVKVINSCSYDSYPIMGYSAVPNATPPCPKGSSPFNNQCWTNYSITNIFNNTNPNKIAPGQYLTYEIAAGTAMAYNGATWTGAVANRRIESGYYVFGDGSGNPLVTSANESANIGQSVGNTATGYEFTMSGNQPTVMDITTISGVFQPATMKPMPYEQLINNQDSYYNGVAGSLVDQPSSLYNIPASTWEFDLSNAVTAGWPQESTILFNYVIPPNATDITSTCSQQNPTCPVGQVCGYSPWTINVNFVPGHPVSYNLVCGKRIGYLSIDALAVIPGGQGNSLIPLPFTETYPGSSLPMYDLYTGNGATGYNPNPSSTVIGCTNWNGITEPSKQCISFNPVWASNVLPALTWIKQGCPSCYTYSYDDPASGFTYFTLYQTNPTNPTPDDGIEIEFCPGGKEIH